MDNSFHMDFHSNIVITIVVIHSMVPSFTVSYVHRMPLRMRMGWFRILVLIL